MGKMDGTTGLPIGGIGTGVLKYSASDGRFYANFRSPIRNSDYRALDQTQFHIFTLRGDHIDSEVQMKAIQNTGRVDCWLNMQS